MTNKETTTKFHILDEDINWIIDKAIVVRTQEWSTNYLVGSHKGCVVALIPYQSKEGRQSALKIAKQIVAANPDYTLDEYEIRGI